MSASWHVHFMTNHINFMTTHVHLMTNRVHYMKNHVNFMTSQTCFIAGVFISIDFALLCKTSRASSNSNSVLPLRNYLPSTCECWAPGQVGCGVTAQLLNLAWEQTAGLVLVAVHTKTITLFPSFPGSAGFRSEIVYILDGENAFTLDISTWKWAESAGCCVLSWLWCPLWLRLVNLQ